MQLLRADERIGRERERERKREKERERETSPAAHGLKFRASA